MNLINTQKLEKNKYELEISTDADAFEEACGRAYRKNIKKMKVPGFRQGKAPRKMVEKLFGAEVFFDDAVKDLYPKALDEAIAESEFDVIYIEKIEPLNVSKEEGFSFKAVCITKPVPEISDYKGIIIEKNVKTVTDEDINKEIDRLRERNSRMISVEDRPAQMGDEVVFDFKGFVDGNAFEGGSAEGHSLVLGSGQFIPGFEDQIIGHNTDDEFDVNVTFPEDYHAEELKAKPAVFKCKLHDIKFKELPEIDDEFVKDVSEFDTLEELKKDITEKMTETFKKETESEFESKLIDKVIEKMEVEVPEIMYEQRIDDLINDFGMRIEGQGMNMETYMRYTGMSFDSIRKTFREQAEKQVKIRLALEKIAEIEQFEISDEEIQAEFQKISDRFNIPVEKVKDRVSEKDIKKDLRSAKAIELVKSTANVVNV